MARPLFLTAVALGAAAAAAQAVAQPSSEAIGDRYGPPSSGGPVGAPSGYVQAAATDPGPALRRSVLNWPGKVEPRAMALPAPGLPTQPADPTYTSRRDPAPFAYPGRNAAVPRGLAPTAAVAAAYAPGSSAAWAAYRRSTPPTPNPAEGSGASTGLAGAPSGGWRPVFASMPAQRPLPAVAPRAAAASVTDPAPAPGYSPTLAAARAAPPNRTLAADRRYGYDPMQDHTVRVYSVARPFGLKPDPAPIPPQFFTATADLGADPPGPLPVNHTTATARAAVVGGATGEDGGSQ